MEKEEKIEAITEKFTKKDSWKSGWATLTLKSDWTVLESFRTKWEFTLETAKIGFIMKGYVWGMTEEIFNSFKAYVIEKNKSKDPVDKEESIAKLFEFFDNEFNVSLTDTTEEK